MFEMKPIGHLLSPFKFKNGTPRQATVCSQARATLIIDKSVFNNPEHSLEGLENFTHVWILFVFHQNNNTYTKAKVKPPRLNGKRVGLFSTRSPYRPNNIGLTLARIESINGACLTVSGVDILDGTPILDLKPYIPQYDCPTVFNLSEGKEERDASGQPEQHEMVSETDETMKEMTHKNEECADTQSKIELTEDDDSKVSFEKNSHSKLSRLEREDVENNSHTVCSSLLDAGVSGIWEESNSVNTVSSQAIGMGGNVVVDNRTFGTNVCLEEKVCKTQHLKSNLDRKSSALKSIDAIEKISNSLVCNKARITSKNQFENSETSREVIDGVISAARWISQPPISKLIVRFTPTSEKQLQLFSCSCLDHSFRLQHLKSKEEAREAIMNILHEDPRSTYRRTNCIDSLYYFTVDIIHVTCWFDVDDKTVEVVRVKPAANVHQCKHKYESDNM